MESSPSQPSCSDDSKWDTVDSDRVFSTTATDAATGKQVELAWRVRGVSGHGSFGVVSKIELVRGGKGTYALKRTKQDRRFRNREVQIMQRLSHPNIIALRYSYYEATSSADEVYLNLILDHIPETIYRTYRNYSKRRQPFPEVLNKLYMHQLFRALSYLHACGVCHRDLKPHNILIDPERGVMTLIDFGSAKVLKVGEPNVSYTCSRYYRAPELIFGSTRYTNNIDLWSTGCILAELLLGNVFFPGSSGIDQLVEIIKVLGTPSKAEVQSMNPSYVSHSFPSIKPASLPKLLPRASSEAVDLLSKLLRFDPGKRISACEAMCHPFFDELKVPGFLLPEGAVPPELFNFSHHELSVRPDLIRQLVPPHKEQLLWRTSRIDLRHFTPLALEPHRIELE